MADTSFSTLAGRIGLRVASGLPAIESSRAELAARLAPGRPAATWPAMTGTLFTLCASAHRWCAERSIAAARGEPRSIAPEAGQALRMATLRDQIQRIAHDWPRQLQPHGEDPQHTALLLRSCPLWRDGLDASERLAALGPWLEHKWLGEPMARWLDRHATDPRQGIAQWALSHRSASPLARLLRHLLTRPAFSPLDLGVPHAPLQLEHEGPVHPMAHLAAAMATQPGFCLQPHWQGLPRSTGPWSRQADAGTALPPTAWHLMVSRVLDVLQLAAPAGAARLSHGALTLAPGEGVAWCEMARGLLVHRVRLAQDGEHLEACQVLAPTEWNFHPTGVLAQALAGLDARWAAADLLEAGRCLAVAFDPCVDFTVEAPTALSDTCGMAPQPVFHHA